MASRDDCKFDSHASILVSSFRTVLQIHALCLGNLFEVLFQESFFDRGQQAKMAKSSREETLELTIFLS